VPRLGVTKIILVLVQFEMFPLVTEPSTGDTSVGLVDNTTAPVPVLVATPVPPLATARVPAALPIGIAVSDAAEPLVSNFAASSDLKFASISALVSGDALTVVEPGPDAGVDALYVMNAIVYL